MFSVSAFKKIKNLKKMYFSLIFMFDYLKCLFWLTDILLNVFISSESAIYYLHVIHN